LLLKLNHSDCFFNLKSHKGANFPANHQFFTDLNRSNRQKIVFSAAFSITLLLIVLLSTSVA